MNKLYRNIKDGKIAGVCAGISDYCGVDVIVIRVIFLLGLFTTFPFGLMYILFWILTPEK